MFSANYILIFPEYRLLSRRLSLVARFFNWNIQGPACCARNVLFGKKEKSATDNNARILLDLSTRRERESVSPRREFN